MGVTIQPIFSLLSRHLSLGGYDGQAVCTTGLSSAECSAAHLVRYFFSDMTGGVFALASCPSSVSLVDMVVE